MRAFQVVNLIVFIFFYAFITYGTVISLTKVILSKKKKGLIFGITFFSILSIATFIFLYIWPNSAQKAGEYSIYFIFNAILFIELIFKIPLSFSFILGILFFRKKKSKTIYFIGLIISICIAGNITYGILFGRNSLNVKQVELKFTDLPKKFDEYKILHFSDIHLGSFINSKDLLTKVLIKANEIKPDVIFFTGDLVNNFSKELKGWEQIFGEINKSGNSFSILGNHDYGNYSRWDNEKDKTDNFEDIVKAHQKFGFKILRNESVVLVSGLDSIYLIGVENWGHPPFPQYANLEKAIEGIPENSFKILLTHDPAHWESKIKDKQNIQLTLSGHTHGLQWVIKKAGIPLSLSYLIRKNWGGLYESDNTKLYVNTGLGTVGIPFRIDIPAELTVITLKRIEVD